MNVDSRNFQEILMQVINTPGVVEAHKVLGNYDIIAEIEGEDIRTIIEVIMNDLRKIPGVKKSVTSLCVQW